MPAGNPAPPLPQRFDSVIVWRVSFLSFFNICDSKSLNWSIVDKYSSINILFVAWLTELIFLVLGRINFKPIDNVKIVIREIVYRSSFVVSIPENYLKKTYQIIQSHFIIYNDYFEIKSEIKELKAQKIVDKFIVEENKRLKKIIDDYVAESDEIVAKIIIDKNPKENKKAKLIKEVKKINKNILKASSFTNNYFAKGGMITKIIAAKIATKSGCAMIIANGRSKNSLKKIFYNNEGTFFHPQK